VGFHRHARQGCKKLAEIKLLFDSTYADKPLSITQTTLSTIAKKTKITKRSAGIVLAVATFV
jgi:hypothetical protein